MPRHLVVQLLMYVKNVQHKHLTEKTTQKVWGVAVLFLIRIRIRPDLMGLGSHPGHGLAKFGLTRQMND
jgi:hypothetical protein